ncbi:MAG: EF-P lysine aminoacylase GenX [Bdellovibrionaceae bacterium]|nr:EF-P lysine aminoacylase GenX [Pseudobdellovibrionaceae bacterium]
MDEKVKINCKKWFRFLNQVRTILSSKGFEEVVTPTLVPAGALEAELYPFQTEFKYGSQTQTLELPTSPEFHLKKLLAAGWGSLFEIKSCFRNEEHSDAHRPEFTMLEFYEVGADSQKLQQTVKDLIAEVIGSCGVAGEVEVPQWETLKIADLFLPLGLKLTPETTRADLWSLCHSLNIPVAESDTFNDLFFRVWLERIEPHFETGKLLCVKDFPPSQAALAALNSQGWADRFEIYWKGFELGNAFFELQDAERLQERYKVENQKRVSVQRPRHPYDPEIFAATAKLPQCSGIAIGLERLFMAIYGLKKISEFKFQDFKLSE